MLCEFSLKVLKGERGKNSQSFKCGQESARIVELGKLQLEVISEEHSKLEA